MPVPYTGLSVPQRRGENLTEVTTSPPLSHEERLHARFIREQEEYSYREQSRREVETTQIQKSKEEECGKDADAREMFAEYENRMREAEAVLAECRILEHFRDTYTQIHAGDLPVVDTILLAVVSQVILNSAGIQPALSGPKGAGKTSSVTAALHLLPPDIVISGSFSNKALFYHATEPGTVFFSDDTTLNEELCAVFKRTMSNFQEETHHHSVADRGKPVTIKIPPRCLFLFTSVGDTGDDQLSDRQYRLCLEQSERGDEAYTRFLLQQAEEGREDLPDTDGVLISRDIIRLIRSHLFRVIIPYAQTHIRFNDPGNRRDMRLFLDFIKSCAVLNYRNRKCIPGDEPEMIVYAELEDALQARELFRVTAEGRKFRLTKEERSLWEFITNLQQAHMEWRDGVPLPALVREWSGKTDKSTAQKVRRLLLGRDGEGGLVGKVPGLTVVKSLVSDTTGRKNNTLIVSTDRVPSLADYQDFVTILHESDGEVTGLPSNYQELPREDFASKSMEFLKEERYSDKIYTNKSELPKKEGEGDLSHSPAHSYPEIQIGHPPQSTPINPKIVTPSQKGPDSTGTICLVTRDLFGNSSLEELLQDAGLSTLPDVREYRPVMENYPGRCSCKGCDGKPTFVNSRGLNPLCGEHFQIFKAMQRTGDTIDPSSLPEGNC